MSEPADFPIYTLLVSLKPADLALGRWAAEAGLARNYFNVLRKSGNPSDATVDALLGVIGMPRVQFEELRSPVRTEVLHAPQPRARDGRSPFLPNNVTKPIPIVGSALGCDEGDLDEDIELTEVNLGDVLGYHARPASLADDFQAYALRIVGDSMWPRFKPGEEVAVSPRASVGIGDDVIVQLRKADGEDGERVHMVLIKELVKRTASYVELRQYRPELTFRIPSERIASIHRVKASMF